eukprot:CAMPEP_0201492128 /NCGR_PEP_ID=MMETSP0151_2-20130828/32093_1 /ASSEMBLY_ACC=CAM_ASM_000257 /TAXON_ID=200890 /ORGANISM="Paramoeba atlantica, Strain 621/1 / CCAP 1560/9" /LENGTH=127 /DNA_ID=CAMNT_0047878795 /DNA_START=84 /DNA_END=467 /DNA_ORIENTATION=-
MEVDDEDIGELLLPDNNPAPKMKLVSSEQKGCATYELRGEGHTMGNALRWGLSKSKSINFVGYTIPHPSEDRLSFRVQTTDLDSIPASEAMEQCFTNLELITNHMISEYEVAVGEYLESQNGKEEES